MYNRWVSRLEVGGRRRELSQQIYITCDSYLIKTLMTRWMRIALIACLLNLYTEILALLHFDCLSWKVKSRRTVWEGDIENRRMKKSLAIEKGTIWNIQCRGSLRGISVPIPYLQSNRTPWTHCSATFVTCLCSWNSSLLVALPVLHKLYGY